MEQFFAALLAPFQILWLAIVTTFWTILYIAVFSGSVLFLVMGMTGAQISGSPLNRPIHDGCFIWLMTVFAYTTASGKKYTNQVYSYRRGVLTYVLCVLLCKVLTFVASCAGLLSLADLNVVCSGTIVFALICFLYGIGSTRRDTEPEIRSAVLRGGSVGSYDEMKRRQSGRPDKKSRK